MYRIALYGKGGIGKSTTVSNLSAAFAKKGLSVLQIGCDPKADSTIYHNGGQRIESVLEALRRRPNGRVSFEDIVHRAPNGVWCVEAGGPSPGTGCAGRGIVAAFEALTAAHAFERIRPEVVLYDVLGDVVCGGFAMPIRKGYADNVFIVTSGENMAIYAAGCIAQAVENFKNRGYARLAGIILNRRLVEDEDRKVDELAQTVGSRVIYRLPRSGDVQEAERLRATVVDALPDSPMAKEFERLSEAVLAASSRARDELFVPIRAGDFI
ncbi:nitrogenase iron protein NifH [Mesosutterella sp. OilRF-GAM-744-9]|uniref:Nitrogenase iron protein NifH n=1 Tax=Mesosutterella porci TaxID=2915351 RepID=A0ABS9MTY5_9BURK|nr:nitrogenase iron protein NifH [Mesosutterella sp. oilRF-744-WT-GAM-9]MCG5031478.1 nitrogenase iron protein NifH [Mesosutterella sp. oilRF-744-WT-GAM-9]